MKTFLLLTLLLISVFLSVSPAQAVRVRGYRRKDGVYVKSHTRRKPRRYRRRRYGALPADLQARALAVIAAENR